MKLSEAIDLYVHRRRFAGALFYSSEKQLRSFLRQCGDVDLRQVETKVVTKFLAGRKGSRPGTWLGKYSVLKMFFTYWMLRGRLCRSPLPLSAPKRPHGFLPYVYSQAELHRLVEGTADLPWTRACLMSKVTFRTLLLVLYGTGMRLGEALKLSVGEVDLANDVIHLRDTKFHKSRLVPIGRDVHRVIEEYLASPNRENQHYRALFQSRKWERIKPAVVQGRFKLLRHTCDVLRSDDSPFQPRLHDLRHTFAVHRVTEWYRRGADVQKLLPALSTYLGHVSLESTQRYLTMTPELLHQANERFERYVSGGGR